MPTNYRTPVDLAVVLATVFGAKVLLAFAGVPFSGPIAVALAIVAASILLHRAGGSWQALGLRIPNSRGEWLKLPLLTIAAMAGTAVVALVIILPLFGQPGGAGSFDFLRGNFVAFAAFMILVVWGTAAIGEELIFRGFVFDRLDKLLGGTRASALAAAVLQAALFGLAHAYQGVPGIVMTGLIGLVMALVYLAGKRWLLPIILAHGLIDTIAIVQLYNS